MPVRRDGTLLSGKRSARDAFEGRAKEGVVANQALFPFFVAQGCTVFLWANQLLGKVGWPEGPHLRRGVFYGKDASSKRELFGWAGNGCNNLIAFAGCTDLAEWAVGRLQSALCQDRPWL